MLPSLAARAGRGYWGSRARSSASSAIAGAATAAAAACAAQQRKSVPAQAEGYNLPPKGGEGPLHRLDPALAERGRAPKPGRVGRLHAPKQTQVVRIVITGGPCAGKSSTMGNLIEIAKAKGYDVYVGPECATMFFNCGFQFPTDPNLPGFHDQTYAFQKNLVKLMLQLERSMVAVAASTGRPSIIVYDRGLLDAKGYMEEVDWFKLLDEIDEGRGITEDYCLKRYDGVIHLVTAADGAEHAYKWGWVTDDNGKPTFRKETPEWAKELDEKMRYCWRNHPRHMVIRNTAGGFEVKVKAASEAVLAVAHEVQPLPPPSKEQRKEE